MKMHGVLCRTRTTHEIHGQRRNAISVREEQACACLQAQYRMRVRASTWKMSCAYAHIISAEVQRAVAAMSGERQERWFAWFLDTCMTAFHSVCTKALAICPASASKTTAGPSSAAAAFPGAIDTCFQWICSRQVLVSEIEGPGAEHMAQFLLRCKTIFSAAMPPGMHEVILAFLASTLQVKDARSITMEPVSVQVCAQLRALGLDALMQSSMTQTATQMLQQATRHAMHHASSLEQAVYPMLQALLCEQLMPALGAILDARPDHMCEWEPAAGTATTQMPTSLAGVPLPDAWDMSLSMARDDSKHAPDTDRESLYLRLEYSLAKAVGQHRLTQLYALVGAYPRSRAAMQDVVLWLEKTDERTELARAFLQALHERLLHPDVDTHAILVYYVNIVYALRIVDTSGVVLSRVLPPVQHYLRTRKDTIQAVVHALLGDDAAFELLRTELVHTQPAEPDVPSGGGYAVGAATAEEEEEEQYTRLEYWTDPTWAPRPVDAGPAFSHMRTRDVVGLLVSIFDDRQGFLHALEQHTAQRLVKTMDYDTSRVQRNNAIFKRRLGEQNLHHCDVMLTDVAWSQRFDTHFHAVAHGGMADHVHPMVISRQFWPDLDTRMYTLPKRLAEALEKYADFYAAQHPAKRVKWLPHVGSVDVDIELEQGRVISVRVTPLQLAVVELVAGFSTDGHRGHSGALTTIDTDAGRRSITADNVATALGLEQGAALDVLRFWAAQGVVSELPAPATGAFELCDDTPQLRA